jgi:hypothetical protein
MCIVFGNKKLNRTGDACSECSHTAVSNAADGGSNRTTCREGNPTPPRRVARTQRGCRLLWGRRIGGTRRGHACFQLLSRCMPSPPKDLHRVCGKYLNACYDSATTRDERHSLVVPNAVRHLPRLCRHSVNIWPGLLSPFCTDRTFTSAGTTQCKTTDAT